jgi:pyrroline-5-carboxylate reductase
MASSVRIGFLGAGMMAEALAKGFVKAGVAQAANMTATDLSDARLAVFTRASLHARRARAERPAAQRRAWPP